MYHHVLWTVCIYIMYYKHVHCVYIYILYILVVYVLYIYIYIYMVGLHLYLLFTRDSNVVSESSGFKSLQTLTGRLIGYIYRLFFVFFHRSF